MNPGLAKMVDRTILILSMNNPFKGGNEEHESTFLFLVGPKLKFVSNYEHALLKWVEKIEKRVVFEQRAFFFARILK